MLPTSTPASVDADSKIPAKADAIVVLIHKQTKANDGDVSRLGEPERTMLNDLLDCGIVTGKSNDLTIHLLDEDTGRRLIVIGLGSRDKFSCECLREAGGTLAKAARKNKLKRVALILPAVPHTLPGMPG